MTPKEKAIQLVEAYWEKIIHDDDGDRNDMCKECALIAVEEILDFMNRFDLDLEMKHQYKWWKEVKQEIEKL